MGALGTSKRLNLSASEALVWDYSCHCTDLGLVHRVGCRFYRPDFKGRMKDGCRCISKESPGMFGILERPRFRSQRTVTRCTRFTFFHNSISHILLQNIRHDLHHLLNKKFDGGHPQTSIASIVKVLHCFCLSCVFEAGWIKPAPAQADTSYTVLELNLWQKSQPNFRTKTTIPWI